MHRFPGGVYPGMPVFEHPVYFITAADLSLHSWFDETPDPIRLRITVPPDRLHPGDIMKVTLAAPDQIILADRISPNTVDTPVPVIPKPQLRIKGGGLNQRRSSCFRERNPAWRLTLP